jgi:hypothetical protein
MEVKAEELIPILLAHGICVDVDNGKTYNRVNLGKLGQAIGYMLDNEVQGHGMVKDMALLIARMAHRLRGSDDEMARKALEYLLRRDLISPEQAKAIEQDAITGENSAAEVPRERRTNILRVPAFKHMTLAQLDAQLDNVTRSAPR